MGSIVVHDNMDVDAIWNLYVDLLEKVEKLSGSVALVALADDKSGCDWSAP